MGYLTPEEMLRLFPEQELVELTNLDAAIVDTVDLVRLSDAIKSAEDEANSYLGVRFRLPLWETEDAVPTVLKSKVADIARYELDVYDPREDVRRRYEDAIAWLRRVAKGEVSLGIDARDTPTDGNNRIRVRTTTPVFTDEAFRGF